MRSLERDSISIVAMFVVKSDASIVLLMETLLTCSVQMGGIERKKEKKKEIFSFEINLV